MSHIKILHGSDFHLGSSSASANEENSCRKFFLKASACDAAVLSGDIFDGGNVGTKFADMFLSFVRSCAVPVFYSCGNHDPYSSDIIKYCMANAPDNLHIFGCREIECFTLERLNTKIYGISFFSEYEPKTLLPNDFRADGNYINIFCVHGDVNNANSVYNPLSALSLSKCGFNYAALGHMHEFSDLKRVGNTFYAYSGIIQGRGFDECGEKGFIEAVVSDKKTEINFIVCSQSKYIRLDVNISGICSYYELTNKLLTLLVSSNDSYSITLVGENSIDAFTDLDYIYTSLSEYNIKITDKSSVKFEAEKYCRDKTLSGFCAAETLKRINDKKEDEELLRRACALLFKLLDKSNG
ncbi:MAG: metallophosphoesterase [Clostridia bacterium]|nr:metallophosphoesterase [Clostridia bacterium]